MNPFMWFVNLFRFNRDNEQPKVVKEEEYTIIPLHINDNNFFFYNEDGLDDDGLM
jgi:hypothetical protein